MGISLNVANIITLLRIVLSCFLLFTQPLSVQFFVLYLAAGISDMLDGAVARHTNTVSELGTKLDTVADLVFCAICFVKLFPLIILPAWLWLWVAAIGIVKLSIMLIDFIRHNLRAEHNSANKLASVALFVLPCLLQSEYFKHYAVFVCAVATVSVLKRSGRGLWNKQS